jgi:hypothetical protein
MDRDKGGNEATRFIFTAFNLECFSHILFSNVMPEANIMSCCMHIKENVERRFGAEAAKSFFSAAQEPSKEGFYSNIGALLAK